MSKSGCIVRGQVLQVFFCVHWRCRFPDKFNSMVDALFLCSSNVSAFSSERCHFLVSSRANSQPTITMIYSTSLIQLKKCKSTEFYCSQPLGCIMPYLTQSLQLHVQVYCSLLEQWTLSLNMITITVSLHFTTQPARPLGLTRETLSPVRTKRPDRHLVCCQLLIKRKYSWFQFRYSKTNHVLVQGYFGDISLF